MYAKDLLALKHVATALFANWPQCGLFANKINGIYPQTQMTKRTID